VLISLGTHMGCDVSVRADVLTEMRAAASSSFPNETGGLLMGFDRAGGIEVALVIGAGPAAPECPDSFTPDRDWQYTEIDRLFEQTQGTIRYLGDWHTHPLRGTDLSALDRSLLREISTTPAAQCNEPLMAVLAGGGERPWIDAFFRYSRRAYVPWQSVQRVHYRVLPDAKSGADAGIGAD